MLILAKETADKAGTRPRPAIAEGPCPVAARTGPLRQDFHDRGLTKRERRRQPAKLRPLTRPPPAHACPSPARERRDTGKRSPLSGEGGGRHCRTPGEGAEPLGKLPNSSQIVKSKIRSMSRMGVSVDFEEIKVARKQGLPPSEMGRNFRSRRVGQRKHIAHTVDEEREMFASRFQGRWRRVRNSPEGLEHPVSAAG